MAVADTTAEGADVSLAPRRAESATADRLRRGGIVVLRVVLLRVI